MEKVRFGHICFGGAVMSGMLVLSVMFANFK